jgi:hypothetical protein
MYKRHQIVIVELEIGAVGTDFSRWTRKPVKGQNMEINDKTLLFNMYTNTTITKTVSKSNRLAIDIMVGPTHPLTRVAPLIYGPGMNTYGPGANRTIDTSTMIDVIFCTRSWIDAWYYGGGMLALLLIRIRVLVLIRVLRTSTGTLYS